MQVCERCIAVVCQAQLEAPLRLAGEPSAPAGCNHCCCCAGASCCNYQDRKHTVLQESSASICVLCVCMHLSMHGTYAGNRCNVSSDTSAEPTLGLLHLHACIFNRPWLPFKGRSLVRCELRRCFQETYNRTTVLHQVISVDWGGSGHCNCASGCSLTLCPGLVSTQEKRQFITSLCWQRLTTDNWSQGSLTPMFKCCFEGHDSSTRNTHVGRLSDCQSSFSRTRLSQFRCTAVHCTYCAGSPHS